MRKLLFVAIMLPYACTLVAQTSNTTLIVDKIRSEALTHSQVMDIAFRLTDASGPRLMGSPGFMRAAGWAKTTLGEWGLENAQLEPWGVFGKGWELQKSYVALTAPYYKPLIAFPKAWCSATMVPCLCRVVARIPLHRRKISPISCSRLKTIIRCTAWPKRVYRCNWKWI